MFGRLPRLYQWRTAILTLVLCAIAGGWIATATPELLVGTGAVMGALGGVLIASSLLHDRRSDPRPIRVRSRTH